MVTTRIRLRNLSLVLRRLLALGLLVFGFSPAALAHPHVTVVAKADFMIDGTGKITGIRHVWTFDEAYSAFAVTGMKPGADGRIAQKDLEDLAKLNVESLSDFKYFTTMKQGRSDLAFAPPLPGYHLTHDGKALTLHFVLPLEKPVEPRTGQTLKIDDETIFVAFSMAEGQSVNFEGNAGGCKVEMRRPATSLGSAAAPKLSEDFFNNLKTGFSDQYATTIRVVCP